ncbi:MAG: fumarylacetoacetate hydrolase family protein [Ignavibacteriales bacterium]
MRRDHSGTELCAVIGRVARGVREEDALDCVYGYTILNDITARGMSFPKNKMFETFAPVGPCLVPKEFYPDPQTVSLRIAHRRRDGCAGGGALRRVRVARAASTRRGTWSGASGTPLRVRGMPRADGPLLLAAATVLVRRLARAI